MGLDLVLAFLFLDLGTGFLVSPKNPKTVQNNMASCTPALINVH